MDSSLDWTNKIDANKIAEIAYNITDEIIVEISKLNLNIFKKEKLNKDEISLILKFPIFISISNFIDRLLIAKNKIEDHSKTNFPFDSKNRIYFENTNLSVVNYYYNLSITFNLLNEILLILNKQHQSKKKFIKNDNTKEVYKKSNKLKNVKNLVKFFLKKKDEFIFKLFKPKIILESNWQGKLFPFWNIINFKYHNFNDDRRKIEFEKRNLIRKLCKKVFLKNFDRLYLNSNLNNEYKIKLSSLFAKHIDYSLPISLIEGLNDRIDYYSRFLNYHTLKEIHSFTGLSYDDNFKIFSMIAKRSKTKLVVHSHGLSNYRYRNLFRLALVFEHADYYSTFGNDIDLQFPQINKYNCKVINLGSNYFNSFKKWSKKRNKSKFRILYPSGPLMQFKTDLQEISPEKCLSNRNKILIFIDKILNKYKSVELVYKPFPGNFYNDPIKEKLFYWIKKKRIKIITDKNSEKSKLKYFYQKSDLVLWDTISTGFGECVASGVPVIVFNNQFEYEQASDRGKFVNDELTKCGIQFFGIEQGLHCFDKIFNNTDNKEIKINALNMIIKDKINPVSANQWKKNYMKIFNNS